MIGNTLGIFTIWGGKLAKDNLKHIIIIISGNTCDIYYKGFSKKM